VEKAKQVILPDLSQFVEKEEELKSVDNKVSHILNCL